MAVKKKPLISGGYSWISRVQDEKGNWYPSKTFKRKVDADNYDADLVRRKAMGSKIAIGTKYTLIEYWRRWTSERRTEVSVSWKNHQNYFFRDHIGPHLGDKEIQKIDKFDISQLMGTLKDKGLSNSTRIHVYNLLNLMFKDAVDFYELLYLNPIRKDHRPKLGEIQRDFLKPEDSRKFLRSVRNHRFASAYWIMLGCGLRIGEVQGLKHGDLDLDMGFIHLKRQWNEREQRLSKLKNDRQTVVQMPSTLVKFLRSKFPDKVDPDCFVVTSSTGTMADGKKIRSNLKKACRDADVKEVSPHELRHSCTELWIEMGASVEDLRRLLNHKSDASTRKYIHRTTERLSRLATQVNMDEDLSDKVKKLQSI